jgi:hypothetical protein
MIWSPIGEGVRNFQSVKHHVVNNVNARVDVLDDIYIHSWVVRILDYTYNASNGHRLSNTSCVIMICDIFGVEE